MDLKGCKNTSMAKDQWDITPKPATSLLAPNIQANSLHGSPTAASPLATSTTPPETLKRSTEAPNQPESSSTNCSGETTTDIGACDTASRCSAPTGFMTEPIITGRPISISSSDGEKAGQECR